MKTINEILLIALGVSFIFFIIDSNNKIDDHNERLEFLEEIHKNYKHGKGESNENE